MNKPKLNLEGLNEQQRQEVIEQYNEWVEGQLTDYFEAPVSDDPTDDQAEAIEYLLNS